MSNLGVRYSKLKLLWPIWQTQESKKTRAMTMTWQFLIKVADSQMYVQDKTVKHLSFKNMV